MFLVCGEEAMCLRLLQETLELRFAGGGASSASGASLGAAARAELVTCCGAAGAAAAAPLFAGYDRGGGLCLQLLGQCSSCAQHVTAGALLTHNGAGLQTLAACAARDDLLLLLQLLLMLQLMLCRVL